MSFGPLDVAQIVPQQPSLPALQLSVLLSKVIDSLRFAQCSAEAEQHNEH